MLKIYTSIEELIGNTPLLELKHIEEDFLLKSKIIAKVEYFNPAGSVKDRAAKEIIDDAEKKGLLKKGSTIIEPTSGNTGIGLALVASARGYKTVIVMPDNMSLERRKIIAAYGAKLVLTDGKLGMKGAIEKAEMLKKEMPGSIIAGQFTNKANAMAHYKTTGPEIWKGTRKKVDIFVAGIGTGGTITGIGEFLKSQNKNIKIIGVEPAKSPVLTKKISGAHRIQGIGAGFIPEVLNTNIIDEVIAVEDEDAFRTTKMLVKKEGLLVGISSGAAVYAAIEIAKRKENKHKKIVVLLPDTGDRYLSTDIF